MIMSHKDFMILMIEILYNKLRDFEIQRVYIDEGGDRNGSYYY